MSSINILKNKLNDELKIDNNDRIWSAEEKMIVLNDSYIRVQSDWDFDWNENQWSGVINSGQQEAVLPSDFKSIRICSIGWNKLIRTVKEVVFMTTPISGVPSTYYLYWGKIWFNTIPSVSINILYNKIFTIDTVVNPDSVYANSFDNAIITYASYLLLSRLGNQTVKEQEKLMKYNSEMNKLKLTYLYQDRNMVFNIQRTNAN